MPFLPRNIIRLLKDLLAEAWPGSLQTSKKENFATVAKFSIVGICRDPLLFSVASQATITCSKLTIDTLEQGVKHVQS